MGKIINQYTQNSYILLNITQFLTRISKKKMRIDKMPISPILHVDIYLSW